MEDALASPMHPFLTAISATRTVAVRRLPSFVVALCVATAGLAACKQEIQFTRTPFAGVIEPDHRAGETTLFLGTPLDIATVITATEAALPGQIARSREFVDDLACDKRKGPYFECIGAVVTTEVTRTGPPTATADGNRLLLTIPVTYDISARGHGWASYLTDRKTGTTSVAVPFDVSLSPTFGLDVRLSGDLIWAEKSVQVLKGKVPLARMADNKIKAQLKIISDELRQALATQPIRDNAEKAWRALHAPVELARGPSLWLRGQPERIYSGGFAMAEGTMLYRLGIDAKVSIHRGERPAPLVVKPLPGPLRQPLAKSSADGSKIEAGQTVLRLPYDVGALALQQALDAAFPKGDLIDTRADSKSSPAKVRVVSASTFPARDKVALELTLDVVEPSRLLGMTGKAYLVGKPIFAADTGILDVREIGFPGAPQKSGKAPEGVVRIGEEPFAGRFASAARLDIGKVIEGMLPRINAMISQPLDETMELSGVFASLHVASVDPIKDGFRLTLELKGTLSILPRSGVVRTTGSIQPTGGTAAPTGQKRLP
jgi:Domain of unknown function (DUF4403)